MLLLYWTADVDDESGSVQFMKDVYNRDGRILEALEGDFTPTPLQDSGRKER